MALDDVEQIFQKSRDRLNEAEELYQDAEKARTEKLETYMDATKAMTGAHQALSSAMIRKANATKDVARLEMIKDAREAIQKRDDLQSQVDKQKKELLAVETKLLMWENIANMAVENLKGAPVPVSGVDIASKKRYKVLCDGLSQLPFYYP